METDIGNYQPFYLFYLPGKLIFLSQHYSTDIIVMIFSILIVQDQVVQAHSTNKPDDNSTIEFDWEIGFCVIDNWDDCIDGCAKPKLPEPLNDTEYFNLLRKTCPELVHESDEGSPLCCSGEALYKLSDSFSLAETVGLGRCPSCIHNFKKLFCQLSCSPQQNKFIKVNKSSQKNQGSDLLKVDEILYFVHDDFANGLYDSCKGVQGLTAGSTVMALMCGAWGQDKCTPQRWLEFMGLSIDEGGQSPYKISFVHSNLNQAIHNGTKVQPLNEPIISCSDAPPGESKCSCRDCQASCPVFDPSQAPRLSPKSHPFKIGPLSGMVTISLLMYIIIASSVFLYFIVTASREKNSYSRKLNVIINIKILMLIY